MVRLTSSRALASVLLLCVAAQAHPAARLYMRQDATATSTDLDSTATDTPTPTEGTTGSTSTNEPTGTDTSEATDVSTTEDPESTDTSTETDTEAEPTATDSESITSTDSESLTGTPTPSVWISVNETDGRISTIVPSVTTSDGLTSTVNLPDPNHTGSVSSGGEDDPNSFLPSCYEGKYQGNGTYAPFCLPRNDTHMYFDNTYYVTWDPSYWELNNSVQILADYIDHPDDSQKGRVAFDSGLLENKIGFITFNVDPGKYENGAIVQWKMRRIGSTGNIETSLRFGPKVEFSSEPIVHPQPADRPPVSKVGLAIGLPLAAVFIIGVIAFLHFRNKDKRSVRGIVIPSMRRRRAEGYGTRKSRAQRAGPPDYQDDVNTRAAAWEMGNMKSPEGAKTNPPGPYQDHDEPSSGGGIRSRGDTPQNPFSDRYEGK